MSQQSVRASGRAIEDHTAGGQRPVPVTPTASAAASPWSPGVVGSSRRRLTGWLATRDRVARRWLRSSIRYFGPGRCASTPILFA